MRELQPPAAADNTRLYGLELGRFIAAFLVFAAHLALFINQHEAAPGQQIFGGVRLPAPLAVQYFFVLSGFVMLHAHHQDFGKISAVPKFWWRRICRIYPVYWLALAIPIAHPAIGASFAASFHIISLEPGLLGPDYTQEYILPAWSLRYELAFYIMFGLCLLPYIGKPLLACWIFVCAWRWSGLMIHLFHPAFMMMLYHLCLTTAVKFIDFFEYYFFAGLAAAAVYLRNILSRAASLVLMAASLVLLIGALPGEMWGMSYGAPLFALGFAFVIAGNILGLAELERHGIIRLGPYARCAGAVSYPLYLLHGQIIAVAETTFPWGTANAPTLYAHFAAELAITVAVSALAAFLFDLPLQRALRHLGKQVGQQLASRRPGRAGPAAPAGG